MLLSTQDAFALSCAISLKPIPVEVKPSPLPLEIMRQQQMLDAIVQRLKSQQFVAGIEERSYNDGEQTEIGSGRTAQTFFRESKAAHHPR